MKKYFLPAITGLALAIPTLYPVPLLGEEPSQEAQVQEAQVKEVQTGKKTGAGRSSLEQELEQALNESGECDRVYWASLPPNQKGIEREINCDILQEGKYVRKFGINLDNLYSVRLKRNQPIDALENYPKLGLGFVMGDDVIVTTPGEEVYSMRFRDKEAERVYVALEKIIGPENNKERLRKSREEYSRGGSQEVKEKMEGGVKK